MQFYENLTENPGLYTGLCQEVIQKSPQSKENAQLPDGNIQGIEEKAASDIPGKLPAYKNSIGKGWHGQTGKRHIFDLQIPELPHGGGSGEAGQTSNQKIQRQGSAGGEIKKQTAKGQAGNGSRRKKGQDTQSFTGPKLNGHGGGAGEQNVLQMGQGGIERSDYGCLGKFTGMVHMVSPSRPSPIRKGTQKKLCTYPKTENGRRASIRKS